MTFLPVFHDCHLHCNRNTSVNHPSHNINVFINKNNNGALKIYLLPEDRATTIAVYTRTMEAIRAVPNETLATYSAPACQKAWY